MKEKISALIDDELDELDARRVLEALRADVELRRTWERYHVIRAAVTRQLGMLVPRDLADRIAARLDEEAANDRQQRLRFWPLVGGFAAAASVAALAIVGLQMVREPAPLARVATAPATAPVALASAGVNAPAAVATTPTSPIVPTASVRAESRLNRYLVGHNEFMPTAGMGSMLPYVRVVADEPDR